MKRKMREEEAEARRDRKRGKQIIKSREKLVGRWDKTMDYSEDAKIERH